MRFSMSGGICLALALATAQEPPRGQETAFRVGSDVSAPVPIERFEPDYSDEARRARYQGTVVLYLEVDENGKPTNIRVVTSLGLGLDQKAIGSVERWRFKPGIKDGKPVRVACNIQVNFRLPIGWNVGQLKFVMPDGASAPVLFQKDFSLPKLRASGTVWLAFDVGANGRLRNVQAVRSDNQVLESAAVEHLQKWHFHPASQTGHAIPVCGTVELTFIPPRAT